MLRVCLFLFDGDGDGGVDDDDGSVSDGRDDDDDHRDGAGADDDDDDGDDDKTQTQPLAEDGEEYLPIVCKGCGVKKHNGCQWMCSRSSVCGMCNEADILRRDVSDSDMAAVSR